MQGVRGSSENLRLDTAVRTLQSPDRVQAAPWKDCWLVRLISLADSGSLGLLRHNNAVPITVPVEGKTFDALVFAETCLKGTTGNLNIDLLVTGGAEKENHSPRFHHYKGEACDTANPKFNAGLTDNDVMSCAKSCGFRAGQYETFSKKPNRDHWHLQLTPGNEVPPIP